MIVVKTTSATSIDNGYTFGIPKTCPKVLENERTLNYQFIQSYDMNDDDIEELIAPTMQEIKRCSWGRLEKDNFISKRLWTKRGQHRTIR